jgi:hypothetical protein
VEFVAKLENQISPAAREATSDLRALKATLDDVSKALGRASGQTPAKAKPPTGDDQADPSKGKKSADKAAKDASKQLASLKSQLGKAAGSIEVPVKLIAGAAGVAGLVGLAKIAIGYAGMAKMEMLTQRLQLNFRSLFSKVDPSPLLRAFEKFSTNFSKTTVTGRALGDILTRTFNGVFSLLERFEPLATAAFQGMLIGALQVENALLKVQIAFAPAIVAIEDFAKSATGLDLAAKAGGVALAGIAGAAVGAAGPFVALAAAITAVSAALEQYGKLQKEWDSESSGQIWRKLKSDLGVGGSQADKEKDQGISSGADYDNISRRKALAAESAAKKANPVPAAPPATVLAPAPTANPVPAKAAGAATGAALGDGIVGGMKSKEAEVTKAGGDLARAADKGVKAAAQIKSPSRLMRENARNMGAGAVQGLEDSKGPVQDAADRSLVPQVKGSPAGGGTGTVESGPKQTHFHFDFSGLTSGNPTDIEQVVRRVINEELWKTLPQLGMPDS